MNIPNHAQINHITSDLNRLARGDSRGIRDWQGNSYRGIIGYAKDGAHLYTLVHWNTPIAQLHVVNDKVTVLHFDARHISSTTRSYQGRIYRALCKVHAVNASDLAIIGEELGRKTHLRKVLSLHPEIEV